MTSVKQKTLRILFIIFFLPVLFYASWLGYRIYDLSAERAILKKDYSDVNNIQYGLLSVDRWRDHITEIVLSQIDEFQLSEFQEDTLMMEINIILNSLISQADEMINEKQKSIGGKLKKFAYRTFVNTDKIRERVPAFSKTIIDQIKKPRSKERLKFLAKDKFDEFALQTRDSIVGLSAYEKIMTKYHSKNLNDLNKNIISRSEKLQEVIYNYTYLLLGIILVFLLSWLLIRKAGYLFTPLFTLSVILALIVLFISLFIPMIEIDARIQKLNFLLIGENIQFHDQVLFYQSKSIMDVVQILLSTGKADSVLVGLLILIFSIIFPVAKLLSTKVILLGSTKWRNYRLIRFFAFKSGKWSMADVMVVAIFMAYIGFKGIINSQLNDMNITSDSLSSIATNKTSLQPGFILFFAFVLYGLILSLILHRISPAKLPPGNIISDKKI